MHNMTINEILKAAGVNDDTIQKVLDDMKVNKIFTASEENLDIRYGKLKTQHEGTEKQLNEANALIETLKKSTKGQEDAQQKITAYEQQVTQLQQELEKTKIQAEAKVELLSAGALDIDYLMFKLAEKGELALDENGKIKDWDDKLAGLKTQLPTQFKTDSKKQIIENKLPEEGNTGDKTVTREEFNKMGYNSRVALRKDNPELYNQMMKG
jgi:hypothetical protein